MLKGQGTLLYKLAVGILPPIYKFRNKCEFRGIENIPATGPVILASSHVSNTDPIILAYACKKARRPVHYMAKDSLFKNKLFGWALRNVGTFPVIRGSGGEDALQEAYDILRQDGMVGIFIEGTRSRDGELLKPKTGASLTAYKTKATVVPIAIIGKDGKLPEGGRKNPSMVNIGKPIPFEDLGMEAESSMHYRRGAKKMMVEITKLRTEAIELMGAVE